jgi:Protein of unknown function (DUF2723)
VKPPVDKKKYGPRVGAALVGVGISTVVFILYLKTLAPGVLPYDSPNLLDSAMLQMQVCVLGISHPTGYPTYLMLSHLLSTHLLGPFFGGSCAYRTNLASALYGALAVGVLFWCAYYLLSNNSSPSRRVVGASVGALAFGVSTTLWSQAVIAEVYTLNALLVALTLLVLVVWRERRSDGYLLLGAFLIGLCMTNHLTSGLLLPGGVLFVAMVEGVKKLVVERWRVVLRCIGLFFVGLSPYLYLPIRAAMDPPFTGNNPTNFERFWYLVSGGNLRGGFFAFGVQEVPGRLLFYLGYLLENFSWVLVVVGIIGFVALLLWERAVGVMLGFLYVGWLFHAIENNIPDVELYFIPTYLVLSLCIAVGVGVVLEETQDILLRISSRISSSSLSSSPSPSSSSSSTSSSSLGSILKKRGVVGIMWVGLVLLAAGKVGQSYATNDMSDDHRGQQIIEEVAHDAKANATILHHRSNLWYMVLVEKRRRDLTLVDPFHHNKDIGYADIVWPDDDIDLKEMNRRYGTGDRRGVRAAQKAARRGPVYVLDQDDVDRSGLREAGWRMVPVDGVLYELIPPEGKRYAGERWPS